LVVIAHANVSSVVVHVSRGISSDVRTGFPREIGVPVPVALVVPAPVRTSAVRLVETFSSCVVVESADAQAGDSRFLAGPILKARAVSVVPVPLARRLVVVAVTAAHQATHGRAHVVAVRRHAPRITLLANDECAAVVLIVITCSVFVMTSDVSARVAG